MTIQIKSRTNRRKCILSAAVLLWSLSGNAPTSAASDAGQSEYWGSYSAPGGRLLIVARWPDDPSKAALFDSVDGEFRSLEFSGDFACTEKCATRLSFQRNAGSITRLRLTRGRSAVAASRDPLHLSSMMFESRDVKLVGRVWSPTTPGRHPAVVLTGGTGRNLRDDFRIYPYLFVRAGFVVYAFDKTGAGESGGDHAADEEGVAELARDDIAAVQALRSLPQVDGRKIGVLGISHGAWVAVESADLDPSIAFVVAIVGGGIPLWQATQFEAHNTLVRKGHSNEDVRQGDALMSEVFAALREGQAQKLPMLIKAAASKSWFADTPLAPFATLPDDVVVDVARRRWANELAYDPRPALAKLAVPILAINGDKDSFVPGERNLVAIATATGRRAVTVLLPGANHWQTLENKRDFTYSPLLRPTVERWLRRLRVKLGQSPGRR